MAFNLGTIGAAVTLDDSGYVNTLGGLEQKTAAVLKKIGGLAAGFFGLNALKQFAQDSVSAYIVQENAVNGLTRALQGIGKGSYSKKLQEVASALQDVTTYGDEATMQAMALGVNMGLEAEQMEDATKAAMGLASAHGLDLNSAMQLVAKAANGSTARLKQYGISVDEGKSKSEQFADVLKQCNDKFDLAKAETFGQRLTQLGNAWGDLKEQVGEFILSLFELDDAQAASMQLIKQATDWMKDNLDELVYEIQVAYHAFEAGVKSVYAIFEPIILYIYNSVKDLAANVTALVQWGIENADKIWEAMPDLLWAHLKDVYNSFKKTFEMILDLAVNFGKAVWQAIRHGSLDGFSTLWDELQSDFTDALSAGMENKVKVLMDAGVSEIPEMQKTAFIKDVVDMYKQLPDKIKGITRTMEQNQLNDFERYQRRREKRMQEPDDGSGGSIIDKDAASSVKNNVAGAFQASVLAGMLGAGKPEQETAKNTKKMVELQEETNRKLDKKQTYS